VYAFAKLWGEMVDVLRLADRNRRETAWQIALVSNEMSRLQSLKRLPKIHAGFVELLDQQVALKVIDVHNDALRAGGSSHFRVPTFRCPNHIDLPAVEQLPDFSDKAVGPRPIEDSRRAIWQKSRERGLDHFSG
jgi:hypothetical protein